MVAHPRGGGKPDWTADTKAEKVPGCSGRVPGIGLYNAPVMSGSSSVEAARAILEGVSPDVVAVYLYGSRARGTASAGSDMDLGVLLRKAPPPTLRNPAARIEDEVERATRLPVQAVILNTASADLVHRVFRDGVLLLDRDPAARIRFEVQARNEYFDLEPVRRLYRHVPA